MSFGRFLRLLLATVFHKSERKFILYIWSAVMTESVDYSEQPLAVEVDDVTMIFNMASESLTNLKEHFIKLLPSMSAVFEEFRALKHILV